MQTRTGGTLSCLLAGGLLFQTTLPTLCSSFWKLDLLMPFGAAFLTVASPTREDRNRWDFPNDKIGTGKVAV